MEPWLWALVISVACGLIGVIYWAGQNRDDKQDARFDRDEETLADHIKQDVSAHERLRAVETKVDHLEREVTSIRERWHDMRGEISQTLSNWYISIVKLIGKDDR
jgi:uncharacterized membrane protein